MIQPETLSFDCIVDGEAVTGARLDVVNPATGLVFASCSVADGALVDRAVAGAARAQRDWAASGLDERRALFVRIADAIQADAASFARLLVLEQGKVAREAADEVAYTVDVFRLYADMELSVLERLFEERHPNHIRIRRPLGVVAGIVPWNYPLMIVAMKIAPALLTGNAIVIKPSPTTPLATLHLGRLCAGIIPPGLVQFLADDGPVGAMLTRHPDIRKIAFTGSTVTGKRVMEAAGGTLKRITLELGGNDPAIILADADIATTAAGVHAGIFTNAGQICGAVKRVYVHDSIYDDFCRELGRLTAANVVGDGLDPATTIGPVQNRMQFEKAMRLYEAATADGKVVASAAVPRGSGFFVPPTLFDGLADDHALVGEEQFAPIVPLMRYSDVDDAVRRANDSPYGLTASVWSADHDGAVAVACRLEASAICINTHNTPPEDVGLSLAKQSGTGWLLGEEGMLEYLETFTVFP